MEQTLQKVGQIDQLKEQLLVAEAKTSQLQTELTTLSAGTSSALVEAAKAATEAAKAATEATKAATSSTECHRSCQSRGRTCQTASRRRSTTTCRRNTSACRLGNRLSKKKYNHQEKSHNRLSPWEPPIPADLKRIKGIGRVFEGRLNQAGIWTFADLAELTPEQIREIVSSGRVENMIEPEEWNRARQLKPTKGTYK